MIDAIDAVPPTDIAETVILCPEYSDLEKWCNFYFITRENIARADDPTLDWSGVELESGRVVSPMAHDKVRKEVTARSFEVMERMTGIDREEMFGTEVEGERVLYVGAPRQAKGLEDTGRFTYVDYEFAEVAEFIRTPQELADRINNFLIGYNGVISRFSLADYKEMMTNGVAKRLDWVINPSDLQKWEFKTMAACFKLAHAASVLTPGDFAFPTSVNRSNIETLLQQLDALRADPAIRAKVADILADEERGIWNGGTQRDPFYGFSHITEFVDRKAAELMRQVQNGIENLTTYQEVRRHVDAFTKSLPADLPEEERRLRIAKEEWYQITQRATKKHTKEADVVVAAFPDMPFKDESYDRIVAGYSISAHIIETTGKAGFKQWWEEINRLLKDNGEAYIFPIQQGMPYGRQYDAEALISSLEAFSPEQGGHLIYGFVENSYSRANGLDGGARIETTLVIKRLPKDMAPEDVAKERQGLMRPIDVQDGLVDDGQYNSPIKDTFQPFIEVHRRHAVTPEQ